MLAIEITPGQVIQLDDKRFGKERVWGQARAQASDFARQHEVGAAVGAGRS